MLRYAVQSIVVSILIIPAIAHAQESDAQDKKLADLQKRLLKLEARVAELEKRVPATKPSDSRATDSQIQQLKSQARARMRRDTDNYTREQLQEAEQLYQVANKSWRSPEAKQALEKLIAQFPDINRTGCAILYLGQNSDGSDKEQLLKDSFEKHGDCFYGNGVQVGAYGRFLLGLYYKDKGDNEQASKLFEEIRKTYPNSIDHSGRLLVEQIPA